MEDKSFENQRRQLWIDYFINYKSDLQFSTIKMIEKCDELLAEFDKRFKPEESKEQEPIMSAEEFDEWLTKRISRMPGAGFMPEQIDFFCMGCLEAYRKLTGKGE